MKRINILPLTIAITAALSSGSILAAEAAQSGATPDHGIEFSGYARFGAAFKGSDNKYVAPELGLGGNNTGRLGNEGFGAEFKLGKKFQSDNGAIWDMQFMLEKWGDDVGFKQGYVSASNVLPGHREMNFWAGRRFNQRPATNLTDYQWMSHDGQGGGFENLSLGGVQLDATLLGQAGPGTDENGHYALTTKLHGIQLSNDIDLNLYLNVGFDEKDTPNRTNAYQLGADTTIAGQHIIVRYSDNADNSVFNKTEDKTDLFAALEGSHAFNDKASIDYLTSVHKRTEDADSLTGQGLDRSEYNVVARPKYQWNDIHSTWVELGYDVVDFDDGGYTNTAYKVTLSQNIAIGPGKVPMLRAYVTYGKSDNDVGMQEVTVKENKESHAFSADNNTGTPIQGFDGDTLTAGIMWEAWW